MSSQPDSSVQPRSRWGEVDLHLAGEGRHQRLWERLGAHVMSDGHRDGTVFAVWAPNAASVRVVGDFNHWNGERHHMRPVGSPVASPGIWELFIAGVGPGDAYKYEIDTRDGRRSTRADPFAFWAQTPPNTASKVFDSQFAWTDQEWIAKRAQRQGPQTPLSIYEVHLGSWRQGLSYRQLAEQLADYVQSLGFTHVEFLPVAEHPFGGSWGYQVTGYFAPTARLGDPDDFRWLVDYLHSRGIGVLVDWVPAHFPKDDWALAHFDGTSLYEHADPRQGEHPDWGTLVFNYGRHEVRNFLITNALFWIEELHVDGLRVDAVASMLYLDYSRAEGQWVPNPFGGRENLAAVEFVMELNQAVHERNPGALTIAEESTAWPGVTRSDQIGGLGFSFKWNMGWMHDTLTYFSRDPVHRRFHHNELTFGLMYAWSEQFVLPLSHDEVVHGKGSLLNKMPGDRWQQFANLRALYAWMWAHPGKPLLFMGGEFGQLQEWSEQRSLDWDLLQHPDHGGLHRMVSDLNAAYCAQPALWQYDDRPQGFQWIDANDADHNFLAFVRWGEDASAPVVCIANLSPVPRHDVRVGLPYPGPWQELLNTDSAIYGGSNMGNLGGLTASDQPWHGLPASAEVTLPPLAVLWFTPSLAPSMAPSRGA